MNKLLLTLFLFIISGQAVAQQAFSTLEEQMTGKEFTESGLEKLSAEELAALNSWIRSRSLATVSAGTAGTGTAGDGRGFENQSIRDMDRSTITSRLVGSFTGWDGQTTFKLENGMIWQQADKDKFYIKAVQNPVITIEPGVFKTWRLSVEGYESECRVERIE
jgi:hypothetical protein